MDNKELTPIQQQVVKSIEKSIEKDQKDLKALEAKLEKDEESINSKIKDLKDQLSDIRGIYMANKELAEMSIDKAKKALSIFIGDIEEKTKEVIEEKEVANINEIPATVEIDPKKIEKKENLVYASEAHEKEVKELPWEVIDDDVVDEEMPFKGIFSKK